MTSSKKSKTPPKPSEIVRTVPWGNFTHNAPVKVSAARLEGTRGYKWFFRSYTTNTRTGAEWIDVYGGNKSYEGSYAFRVEEVELIIPKQKRARKNV